MYSPWGRKELGEEIEAQRSDGRQQTRGGARTQVQVVLMQSVLSASSGGRC